MFVNFDGKNISEFLQNVHEHMIAKYINDSEANYMKDKAIKMERFFRDLTKTFSRLGEKTSIEDINSQINNEIFRQIALDIKTQYPQNNFKLEKFFMGNSGKQFEQRLGTVMASIIQQAAKEKFDKYSQKRTQIGTKHTNINLTDDILSEQYVQEVLKEAGVNTKKKINNKSNQFFVQSVQGKIDVAGYEVQVSNNISSELKEIYELLSQAKFTAKSYGKFYWNRESKTYEPSNSLILGSNTNPFRSYYGVLTELGYDRKTAITSYISVYKEAKRDIEIKKQFSDIRFIYDLIGSGSSYINKELQYLKEPNYLIYNDTNEGNIYIRATADILRNILKGKYSKANTLLGKITLDKAYFKYY